MLEELGELLVAPVPVIAACPRCEEEAEAWVAEVRSGVTSLGEPPADEMFTFAYADPPETVRRQREELGDA